MGRELQQLTVTKKMIRAYSSMLEVYANRFFSFRSVFWNKRNQSGLKYSFTEYGSFYAPPARQAGHIVLQSVGPSVRPYVRPKRFKEVFQEGVVISL